MLPKFGNDFEFELWIASLEWIQGSIDLDLHILQPFHGDHKGEAAANTNLGLEGNVPSELFNDHL